MRIGVDIAPLRPPYTGVSNYELWLLDALLASSDAPALRGFAYRGWRNVDRMFVADCILRAGKREAFPAPLAEAPPAPPSGHARVVSLALRYLRMSPAAHAAASDLRGRVFAGSLRRQRIDLFHAFAYRAPSRRPAVPVIPVVWDLSHIRHPETHPASRLRWMRHVGEACRDAPAIHTISEFTSREIVEVFGVDPERIHVIPPAVSAVFRETAPHVSLPLDLVPRGYALTVSTLEPRKNLRTLVAAFAALAPAERRRMPLVVVGARGWGDLGLDDTLEPLLAENSIRLAGYVTDAELAALYRDARTMFYPSLYEGFGMPVIEALATGTPVVASDAASLPEAVGGAGRLVRPLDVPGWTAELRRALGDDDAFRPEMTEPRRARALAWSWEDAARRTLAMYRAALRRPTSR